MKKKICIIGGSIIVSSIIITECYFHHHYKKEYYHILNMWGNEKSVKERKIKEAREIEIKLETLIDKYNDLKSIVNKIYGDNIFKSNEEGEINV